MGEKKIMFLDESGDHNLTVIDAQYPMFVLGGVILDKRYAESVLEQRVSQFKRHLFGRDDIILHTSDITRNRNGFEKMRETAFREEFYVALNGLMRGLTYTVVACAIRKHEHLSRYGFAALDPYLLSLKILAERFCFELGDEHHGGAIIAEKRNNPVLDGELELAWKDLRLHGTEHVPGVEVRRRISGLSLREKKENIAGLQLADLVVSPIGRYVLGKNTKEDWRIIESKLRRRQGTWREAGLVILPKE